MPQNQELGYMPSPKAPPDRPADVPTFSWAHENESFKEKFWRKFKDNPLIIPGLGATFLALTVGLWTMKTGNRELSQRMMRVRVMAQGFTVFALIGGVGYSSWKDAGKKKKAKELKAANKLKKENYEA